LHCQTLRRRSSKRSKSIDDAQQVHSSFLWCLFNIFLLFFIHMLFIVLSCFFIVSVFLFILLQWHRTGIAFTNVENTTSALSTYVWIYEHGTCIGYISMTKHVIM
jgi:hypothetical protein